MAASWRTGYPTCIEALAHFAADLPTAGTILGPLSETALNAAVGVLAGAVVLVGVKAFGMLKRRRHA